VLLESTALGLAGARVSLGEVYVRQEDVCELVTPTRHTTGVTDIVPAMAMAGPRPKNVILIVLESVGVEFLSLYGSQLQTTPRLSGERNNSLVFDSYYAPVGWTAYSLFSIVHSQLPPLEGYDTATFSMGRTQGETLANLLSARGYQTAFMAAGDPDWASDVFFEGKGFTDIEHMADLKGATKLSSWGVRDGVLFDRMIYWIIAHQKQPFFLMGWSDQSHHPYRLEQHQPVLDLLPAELKGHSDLARYVTLVHELDRQIGRLLDALRTNALAATTVVAITADHGEAFGTLHRVSGHGFTVYDEEVRVPLVLWNPVLFAGGGRLSRVGTHVDLNATLADILGIVPPEQWEGRSLLAEAAPAPAYLYAAGWGENLMGVRDGDWKYVFDARQGRDELYNVRADQDEQINVVAANPELALRLRQKLAARLHVDKADRKALAAACRDR
jgi:arylsulfatase A-like enzyme